MNGESLNITKDNLDKLQTLFPDIFSEGKIDMEKFKAIFSDDINFANERYVLNWAGKADAFKVLQIPTTATLKPQPDQSINFDTTQNIFIEGENLEVLKVLQKAYYGKIKCIIIDPPYNTGSDSFIYPDSFKENKTDYEKRIGDKDEEGYLMKEGMFRKNSKDSGHYHSNWLSMMYPRLFLAKNVLKDDGVIFVHIDDNEVHNLRLLMNEIYGEENFVGQLVFESNPKGRVLDKYFATSHEYVIVYSRNQLSKGSFSIDKDEEEIEEGYSLEDNIGKYRELELRNTHREFGKHNRPNLFYPLYYDKTSEKISLEKKDGLIEIFPIWEDGFEGCWTWGKTKVITDNKFLVAKEVKGNYKIYRKSYANGATKKLKTFLNDKSYHTEKGQAAFNQLFESKEKIFQSPKSPFLLKELLRTSSYDEIVLDFFGGSGTIAQAIMELNREDGGTRKFVMVQLPENAGEESEAYKAGYKTIADISKERIRRVIQKIEQEKVEKPKLFDDVQLDLGFKVFKLSPSNFKIWRGAEITEENLAIQLDAFTNPVKEESKTDNMLFELMLKAGYLLTDKVEPKGKYYSVNDGELIVALEELNQKIIDGIIAAKPKKVITLDNLFTGNDQLKTNTVLQMKDAEIDFKTI